MIGAAEAFDYAGDFRLEFKKKYPQGADLVFACAGGDSLQRGYDCVRKGGRLVTIVEKGDESLAKAKGVALHYVFVEPHAPQLELLRTMLEQQDLKVHLGGTFPLDRVAEAHERIESAHTRGKLALTIDGKDTRKDDSDETGFLERQRGPVGP